MNQTKKRLAIIKLAISMTDTETIQLQVLKLGLLQSDSKMKEILRLLNEKSYARAQGLISDYIETSNDTTILQRTSQTKPKPQIFTPEEAMLEPIKEVETTEETLPTLQDKIQAAKDQAIIDEFELFTQTPQTQEDSAIEDINYDTLFEIAPPAKKMSTETVNYDALLNVEAQDVLTDNITLDISQDTKDNFFEEESISQAVKNTTVNIDNHTEDNFFSGTQEILEKNIAIKALETTDIATHAKMVQDEFSQEAIKTPNNSPLAKDENFETKISEKEFRSEPIIPKKQTSKHYKPIQYIEQKLKNMSIQYPAIETSDTVFSTIDTWLSKIANHGYNEHEIEELIKKTEKLSHTNKAEAAQLLLLLASTESTYAQFRLARALYRGEILQKNQAESFTLISRLALDENYPEAICDLAQFYENGIGVTQDYKKAEVLYKEAMELGILRAIEHYERVHKKNKGFFSALKK